MSQRKGATSAKTDVHRAEIERLTSEVESLKQGWQRTQADFENFRRRTQGDQQQAVGIALGRTLMQLAPIGENLRRAVDHRPAANATSQAVEAWADGVASIARQFDQALMAAGLDVIDPAAGQLFNPHEHEAIAHQHHSDHAVDTIIQVIERGYRVEQRVLQPAKVVVSAGSEPEKGNSHE